MNCLHSSRCNLASLLSKYLQDIIIKQTLIFIYSFQCVNKQIPAYSTSCCHKMPLAEIVPLNPSNGIVLHLEGVASSSITLVPMHLMKFIKKKTKPHNVSLVPGDKY